MERALQAALRQIVQRVTVTFHVPGSTCLTDEFQFPSGQWCSAHRAITYNSGLTWADALPTGVGMRNLLTADAVRNIATLARVFRRAETVVTSGRFSLESPFSVVRWWDPTDRQWNHGRRCCLRLQGMPLAPFLQALQDAGVRSTARSGDTLEAIIPKPSRRGPGFDA